jgi:ribose 5-phosphate isomerase B
MKVGCGFDHAGLPLRDAVVAALESAGHEPVDLGCVDDYPDIALEMGRMLARGGLSRGVLVCGSGAGVAVAACKLAGVRAAVAHDHYTAAQCVTHDDCNVLCLGARVVGPAIVAELVVAFAQASFDGEPHHARRLEKLEELERRGLEAEL